MNVDMLSEDIEQQREVAPEVHTKRLERIRRSIDILSDSVQDFLRLSVPFDVDPVPVDIDAFIREIGDFIEPEGHAAGIEIHYRFDTDIPRVMADRRVLSTALLNIIINSKEAIGENGTITISTSQPGAGPVRISVDDTGGGIPPGHENKVFSRFFSTKDQGTGLGLIVVKRVVKTLDGSISFENRPGEGVVFHIDLPAEGAA
jgi:signal transduction histidine kinase